MPIGEGTNWTPIETSIGRSPALAGMPIGERFQNTFGSKSQSCFSWYANRRGNLFYLENESRRSPALAGMPIGDYFV